MATAKLILNGVLYWAKVFPFNREKTNFEGELIKHKHQANLVSDEDAGEYQIEIHLSKEEAAKIAQVGARQKPKIDKETGFPKEFEDGYAYRFTRLHCVPKAPAAGGAPKVVFSDGRAFDPDTDGLIGNGSNGTLEIRIDKFKGKNAKGEAVDAVRATLEKVIIRELVTFVKDGEEETVLPAKKTETKKNDDFSDEIPF